ncbi:MAG TPA: T9SS type A sorting domain-containing protein [Saprospiraceae bacterium]|nr:T9SS type A sorting domain-containing protein [Saprospiraceae bacterium]HND89768.1 T9SS type A sorting domain-containing protein [Saprospiraceae bacterium]
MKSSILTLSLFLLALVSTQARHILGGNMTYRYVGDSVEVTMVIYRDCLGGGAPYDNPAQIGIFRGQSLWHTLEARIGNIEDISIIDLSLLPCTGTIDPPPVTCLEKGTYVFTIGFPPGDTTNTYTIAYQRCCRVNTLGNILDPGSIGHTLNVSITPAARAVKNDSPSLKDVQPSLYACLHRLNFLNLSATDAQHDSLVYRLCSPLSGGGPVLTFPGVNTCEGAIPTPPCSPPFDSVQFTAPRYSVSRPFVADSFFFDSNTGRMRLIPRELGVFAYAICIDEYRKGKLLSTIQHESVIMPLELTTPTADLSASSGLHFAPNPAHSELRIDLSDWASEMVDIRVIDAMGRSVISLRMRADAAEILPVGSMPPGVYSIRVESGRRIAEGKFVRQ